MNRCPNCGAEFEGKFCPECGTAWQEEKTCPNCGATLRGSAKFCNECGYSFGPPAPAQLAVKKRNNAILYLFLHNLPAILLGLFAVLVLAFLAAPAVKLTISGLGSASESGYEVLNDQTLSSLKDCFIAMIVFACFTAVAALVTLIILHNHPAAKFHPVLFVGFAAYLAQLIIASVAISKIKDLDGGAGMLSAEACPILVLVFAILFALGAVGAALGSKVLHSSYPQQTDKINWKESKILKWLKKHERLVVAFIALVVIGVALGISIPFFLLASKNDTYYACRNGEIVEEKYIVLQNGKWTDETGASGKYSVSGNTITVRIRDNFTNTTVSVKGTVKNGVLKLENENMSATYRTRRHEHNFSEWEEEYAPTCTAKGLNTRACDCGKTETKEIEIIAHSYGDWTVTMEPTCTEEGTATILCSMCGDIRSKVIKPTGHLQFENGLCSACGAEQLVFTLNNDTYSVKMSGAGRNSTKVEIPAEYNSLPVTSIGDSAFSYCSGLTSITIPDSVTSIGDSAFSGCSGLTGITIPDSVTSIGDSAFSGCSGLTTITIPDSVTSIGNYAFADCSGLTTITIPDSVTSIGKSAFRGCSGLTSVAVGAGNPTYHSSGNCIIETESKTLIVGFKNSVIPTDGSVTAIGSSAFYGCSGLTSITIPDSVTSIGDSAFLCCSGLTSITIPDSVTSIGEDAFKYCSGLTSVTIPDSITSIGKYAFEYCNKLETVYWNTSTYNVGTSIFSNCPNFTTVVIGEKVTGIASYAFEHCRGLTSVTIPNSVTSLGWEAFGGCSGLTSITIPDSVTSIGKCAFVDCSGLTSITYNGTKAQWNAIIKGKYWNLDTGDYTVHCTDGNLDKNGNEID